MGGWLKRLSFTPSTARRGDRRSRSIEHTRSVYLSIEVPNCGVGAHRGVFPCWSDGLPHRDRSVGHAFQRPTRSSFGYR